MSVGNAVRERLHTIVVGLGAMGSSTLYHLARSGFKVLGLERQAQIPHQQGSSHGETRIIRLSYHEGPEYTPLLRRAYDLWGELGEEVGERLLQRTGYLDISPDGSLPYNLYRRSLAATEQYGLEHEKLTHEQVNRRFPGFNLPPDFKALFQPDGGILCPERCVSALVQRAQHYGADVRLGERVTSWEVDDVSAHVTVHCASGATFSAERLVLTAGPWIGQLLPWLQGVCTVERQVVAWFQISEPQAFQPERFPVFIIQDATGFWYGFPEHGGSPGFKLGKFKHLEEQGDPDALHKDIRPADEQLLREGVRSYFPKADGPMLKAQTCLFTNIPDNNFIIDLHPQHKQVVVCSACSGHGFKMASSIGEMLAQLAASGDCELDRSLFRISRHRLGFQDIPAAAVAP